MWGPKRSELSTKVLCWDTKLSLCEDYSSNPATKSLLAFELSS
jgi:hypothetical protein